VVASLIAVSGTALSQARPRLLDAAADHKVGGRLLNLLYVVESLSKDSTLSTAATMKALVTPAAPQADGSYLDVSSAIQLGTFDPHQLLGIADAALKHLRSRYESDKQPDEGSLYKRAHAS
jgi:hypothetical protein